MSRLFRNMYFLYIGAELRNWLLFFAVPVLHEILPIPYLSHLALLVSGIYIYSSQQISPGDFQLAQQLLNSFYAQFSDLYGKLRLNLNISLKLTLVFMNI